MTTAALERSLVRGNAARDFQLKHNAAHDPVSNLPRVLEPPPPPRREASRTFASGAPFDILSGTPLPPELQSDAAKAARPPRPLVNYAASAVRRRAVDILSNTYRVDHEARAGRDATVARTAALKRYWETHNFNPLTQTYYDADKEAAAAEVSALAVAVQGAAQAARLPPSLRIRTGAAYDIVGHVTRDPDTLNTVDLMDTRPLRIRTRAATEARLHSAGEAAAAGADVRAVSRMRMRRYEELTDPRGYDILTGTARDPDVLDRALAGREPSRWDRIVRDLHSAPAGAGAGAEW